MNNIYTADKTTITEKDVESAYIVFSNGDYVALAQKEVVKIDLTLCDKLVLRSNSLCPVVHSGTITLRLYEHPKYVYDDVRLYNRAEYNQSRIDYVTDRCVNQNDVECVQIFAGFNESYKYQGDISATVENDLLILHFATNKRYGTAESRQHCVGLPYIKKQNIRSLRVDFENCECFEIDGSEIAEFCPVFDTNLQEDDCCGYVRTISGGYIIVKFDNELDRQLYETELWEHRATVKNLIKRLCDDKDRTAHDITALLVKMSYDKINTLTEECLTVDNLDEDDDDDLFVGGYCKIIGKNTVAITFGENTENTLEKICQSKTK